MRMHPYYIIPHFCSCSGFFLFVYLFAYLFSFCPLRTARLLKELMLYLNGNLVLEQDGLNPRRLKHVVGYTFAGGCHLCHPNYVPAAFVSSSSSTGRLDPILSFLGGMFEAEEIAEWTKN